MSSSLAPYRGRFAPTPTGPLHFGSLVTALASFLDARHHKGVWLVRIEDIDPQREQPGAAPNILATLAAHGMISDEPVRFQSRQNDLYDARLAELERDLHTYPCPCSRKQLQAQGGRHLSICGGARLPSGSPPDSRPSTYSPDATMALRFRITDTVFSWQDLVCGPTRFTLNPEVDDFVLKRREGFYAYQLAVVADDIDQGITHIVRGQDLLDNTPMQMALYLKLGATLPSYAHTPLVVSASGQKLSKQNRAPAIEAHRARQNLCTALTVLGHPVPAELNNASIPAILQWAAEYWELNRLSHLPQITLPVD